jgi:hypothetical protein
MPSYAAADWNDGETSVLIGAWGAARQRRRSGRLALKDWRALGSAVFAHGAAPTAFTTSRGGTRRCCSPSRRRRGGPTSRAFLASPDGPPPGFPVKPLSSVKEQELKEKNEKTEEVSCGGRGLAGSWTVPRNGTAGAVLCPGAVVTKLAVVYERVELARLDSEEVKMEVEAEKAVFDAVELQW